MSEVKNLLKTDIYGIEQKLLEKIIIILVEVYHPVSIYLFGSYAWGKPDKDSDADIAVIVSHSDEKAYLRPQKGTLALWEINLSIDLLIFTIDEFNQYVQQPSSLQYKIKNKGINIYEAM